MISKPDKNKLRQKRHRRVRGKLSGTADRPRLNVFRSNTGIYAQVIDDVAGVTLASASTLDKEVSKGTKTEKPLLSVNSLQNVQTLKVFQKWCSTAVDIYITDV
ncbi:50S ribosomal protein L18 [Streptococcus pneumoniae]|nr:50S ribosomal protein L18 [Streptococcus pneumoniae]SNJ71093.1 50S ribosomal protein L18 [Streptococcus pneumoniae]